MSIFRELALGSEKWISIFGTVEIIGVVPRSPSLSTDPKSGMEPSVVRVILQLCFGPE